MLSKRSLWVIRGLVALHTRLCPIWSILGLRRRMLTVALPSLEAFFERSKLNLEWSSILSSILRLLPTLLNLRPPAFDLLSTKWCALGAWSQYSDKQSPIHDQLPAGPLCSRSQPLSEQLQKRNTKYVFVFAHGSMPRKLKAVQYSSKLGPKTRFHIFQEIKWN